MKKWNAEAITLLLDTNDKAVERAILVLFQRQTFDEQASRTTRWNNKVGFRANHASKGTYYAKWIKNGNRLTGYHLANARKITKQYTRQLLEAIAEKQK